MINFEIERNNFPVLNRIVYLDTSFAGAIPQFCVDSIVEYLNRRCNFGLNSKMFWEEWEFAERVRGEVAKMIGASTPNEIAFGLNQSVLFSIFSNGIDLKEGDNVITYDTAYASMTYTWLNKKSTKNIEVRFAKSKDGCVLPDDIFKLVDERTKAITVCFVDKHTGYRHDLKEIGEFCHKKNIAFGVDATQGCGAMKIDVEDMKVDFLAASTYKFMTNVTGIGFAYIRKEFMDTLKQESVGWTGAKDRRNENPMILDLSETASRFEEGSIPFSAIHGLSAVVNNYIKLGADNIQEYILGLVEYAYKKIETLPNVEIVGNYSKEHRSGLVILNVPYEAQITDKKMREHGIQAFMLSPTLLRVGIHYYNNKEDIDSFCDCMRVLLG